MVLSSRDQAWRNAKGRTTRRRVFSVSPSGSSLSLSARTSCAYASPKTPSATKRVSVSRLIFMCLSSFVMLKCMFSEGFYLPIVFCFDMTDHQHLNIFIPRSSEFPILSKKMTSFCVFVFTVEELSTSRKISSICQRFIMVH